MFHFRHEYAPAATLADWKNADFQPVYVRPDLISANKNGIVELGPVDLLKLLTSLTYNNDHGICRATLMRHVPEINARFLAVEAGVGVDEISKNTFLDFYLNIAECGLEHTFIWDKVIGTEMAEPYRYAFHRILQDPPRKIDIQSALVRYVPEIDSALFELTRAEIGYLLLNELSDNDYEELCLSIGVKISKSTLLEWVRPLEYKPEYVVLPLRPPRFVNARSMWTWIENHIVHNAYALSGTYENNDGTTCLLKGLASLQDEVNALSKCEVMDEVLYAVFNPTCDKAIEQTIQPAGRILELRSSQVTLGELSNNEDSDQSLEGQAHQAALRNELEFRIEYESKLQTPESVLLQLKQRAGLKNCVFGASARSAAVYYRNEGELDNYKLALELEACDVLSTPEWERYLCRELSQYTKIDCLAAVLIKPINYRTIIWVEDGLTTDECIALILLIYRNLSALKSSRKGRKSAGGSQVDIAVDTWLSDPLTVAHAFVRDETAAAAEPPQKAHCAKLRAEPRAEPVANADSRCLRLGYTTPLHVRTGPIDKERADVIHYGVMLFAQDSA